MQIVSPRYFEFHTFNSYIWAIMEKIKIIFWIIAALIYFFLQRQKAKSQKPIDMPDLEPQPKPPKKGKTFEELLQEIENTRRKTFESEVETIPRTEIETKKREVLEDTDYDYRQHDQIYQTYENAKKEAFNRPSLEEDAGNAIVFNRTDKYKLKRKSVLASEYRTYLADPKKIRNAVILKEILTTKF